MTDFKLPDIGEGIVECEVVEWRIQEGDVIEEDQPVVEVMTDKALVEITAPEAGRVSRLFVPKGEIAKVHAPLFAYEAQDASGEADASTPSSETSAPQSQASKPQATEPASDAEPVTSEREKGARPAANKDFILPDIGEGIVECEVVEWRIAEGDMLEEDQPVVDVMTDKALVEITAPEAGRVAKLHVAKGEIAKVHAPLFAYEPADGDTTDGGSAGGAHESSAATSGGTPQAAATNAPAAASGETPRETSGQGPHGRIPASPAVRRLLREHGLRLGEVPGSGKQGRVLKEDVQAFLSRGQTASEETSAAAASPAAEKPQAPAVSGAQGEVRVEPMRGIRAAMARKMVASASSIPHFQYGEELDVTELLALRERLKPEAQARDARLTLMPFFMKAMALAIRDFPILNSRLNEAGDEIHYLPSCNIGMAVDGKAGLMVPNVKGVERLSLLQIAGEIQRLTEGAREGRVASADLQEGTISISNIGALGGTYAAPIINAPEVAIVAIGKTQWLPRFDADDNVVKRAIMTITWAGDHRLIDGGTIARFCNAWKGYLEAPETMLLHLG